MEKIIATKNDNNPFQNSEIICSYSRHQEIEDGVLTDVSSYAKELGIKIPVAFTASLINIILDIPKAHDYQTQRGRVHDVLFLSILQLKKMIKNKIDISFFDVTLQTSDTENPTQYLQMVLSCGDTCEPVLTIGYSQDY